MDFILGCNYWASNAGTEMWRCFDEEIIENDIRILSKYDVKYLRVFPNWRDFQPVVPRLGSCGAVSGYCLENGKEADNAYYLDETMLSRFSCFLNICEKYDIKLIIGLITGWMSGGLFIPSALYGKNVITDHLAQYFEQLFIKGFVEYFKDRESIYAWDLGNECNCMGEVNDRTEAANWTAMISNAIRATDPSRLIISGMHSLELQNNWTIQDQGMFTDILTTHPYPFWCEHTRIDETLSLRTTLHPTAQTKLYSEIGKKPCLAEEIGTMGPMLCSNENAAKFLRINMFSLWANGASGVMWWCANEQTQLSTFPYTEQMVEQELGMLDEQHNPKPVLEEMKSFSDFLKASSLELPPAKTDAVCILTRDQKQWGIGYMTYILSRMAGFNLSFSYGDDELPNSNLYLMPSVNGVQIMPKGRYEKLKQKIHEGADLYISADNAILAGFESLTGLKVIDSCEYQESYTAEISGHKISFSKVRNMILQPAGAEVLLYDNKSNPLITVNRYGKGRVFFLNAPIENSMLDKHNAFKENYDLIYKTIFHKCISTTPVKLSDSTLLMTYHPADNGAFAVILNHFGEDKELTVSIAEGYSIEKVYYGNIDKVKAYDACVFKIAKM